MESGFITLHRKMVKWEWFAEPSTSHLFLYCILRANYQDAKWRGIAIKRGAFITSYKTISNETGLTTQQIRTSFKKLESTGEVTRKTTNRYQVITVANYDSHQDINKQATNKQQTSNIQTTTDNNNNNNNKDNNIEAAKAPGKKINGSRIPVDWSLDSETGEQCEDILMGLGYVRNDAHDKIARAIPKFKDHWLAQTGQRAIKADWNAMFRNWIRTSIKFEKEKNYG